MKAYYMLRTRLSDSGIETRLKWSPSFRNDFSMKYEQQSLTADLRVRSGLASQVSNNTPYAYRI